MVGSAMAMDLARDPGLRVTVVDARDEALARVRDKHGVAGRRSDLSDPVAVKTAVADADIVLYCHHGMRSDRALQFLQRMEFSRVRHLTGGVDAWAVKIDPSLPRY